MDKITQILEDVVRCKYFEAGVHINNPKKNSYQDGLGRTTQTLDHVFVVHILIWDKWKSQINKYSDIHCHILVSLAYLVALKVQGWFDVLLHYLMQALKPMKKTWVGREK
jgi:hypothetical protein